MSGGPSFPDEALRANIYSVRNMSQLLFTGRHLLGVLFVTRLDSNLRAAVTGQKTTESLSHTIKLTCPQKAWLHFSRMDSLNAEPLLLVINIKPSEFPHAIPLATIKVKVVSKELRKPRHLSKCYFRSYKPLETEPREIWGLIGVWSAGYGMWRREVGNCTDVSENPASSTHNRRNTTMPWVEFEHVIPVHE